MNFFAKSVAFRCTLNFFTIASILALHTQVSAGRCDSGCEGGEGSTLSSVDKLPICDYPTGGAQVRSPARTEEGPSRHGCLLLLFPAGMAHADGMLPYCEAKARRLRFGRESRQMSSRSKAE